MLDRLLVWIGTRDWPLTISVVKDLVTCISVVIGSTVAVLGLKAWREQLKGKSDYELARGLLTSLYKLRNQYRIVRGPFHSAGEIHMATEKYELDKYEENPKFGDYQTQAVLYMRMTSFLETFGELEIFRLQAEALWDGVLESEFKDLIEHIKDLQISIQLYPRAGNLEKQGYEKVVFGIQGDENDKKFVNIVEQLQEKVKPKLLE